MVLPRLLLSDREATYLTARWRVEASMAVAYEVPARYTDMAAQTPPIGSLFCCFLFSFGRAAMCEEGKRGSPFAGGLVGASSEVGVAHPQKVHPPAPVPAMRFFWWRIFLGRVDLSNPLGARPGMA